MNTKSIFVIILIFVAIIWLPTFTPEDFFTTFVIIQYIGWTGFLIGCGIIILLLIYTGAFKKLFGWLKI